MTFALLIVLAILLGGIPFGLIVARLYLDIDIRTQGSGNIGMTNVMRVGGKVPGIITFVLDFFKGTLAVLIARFVLDSTMDAEWYQFQINIVGIAAVLGHVFSVFLKFKGGKGISTLFGVLAGVNLLVGTIAGATWLGMFLWQRISSLSALTMLTLLPVYFMLIPALNGDPANWQQTLLFSALVTLLVYKHKENIQRLLKGEEKKLNKS